MFSDRLNKWDGVKVVYYSVRMLLFVLVVSIDFRFNELLVETDSDNNGCDNFGNHIIYIIVLVYVDLFFLLCITKKPTHEQTLTIDTERLYL